MAKLVVDDQDDRVRVDRELAEILNAAEADGVRNIEKILNGYVIDDGNKETCRYDV